MRRECETLLILSSAWWGSDAMGKGFGIAGLIVALIAIPMPVVGLYVSVISVVLAAIAALAGDRTYATATTLVAFVNTLFLSPSTWLLLSSNDPGTRFAMMMIILIIVALPFAAMVLRALVNKSRERITQTRKEPGPTNMVPLEVAPPQNPRVVFVVRMVAVMVLALVVVTVLMQQVPQLESDVSRLVGLVVNYVVDKKKTAVTETALPPKPIETPVVIPHIEIKQEPLGVPGRVTGIRIISPQEMPTTVQAGGPTAVATDKQTGLSYACYLEGVFACDEAFKKESGLQQKAREIQAPPIPTREILPPPPVVEKNWIHNGSSLKLEMNGTRRRFLFIQPREGLLEEGVTEGMVAFDGIQNGDWLEGTAYVFSRRCGPIGFRVSGEAQADTRIITLKGPRPYVDAQCRPVKSEPGSLVFLQLD